MTLREALEDVLTGRAVSRRAWKNADLIVTLHNKAATVIPDLGPEQLTFHAPWALSEADIASDDWFVVGSVN